MKEKRDPHIMKTGKRTRRLEWVVLIGALCLANFPMFKGELASEWIFMPGRVLEGEWWRVLTHAFVHVSPYHLLLDASAFFILYYGLTEKSLFKRTSYLVGGAMGSLIAAVCAAPAVATIGLCGLSGVAHGLMAVSAIEYVSATQGQKNKRPAIIGGLFLLLVVGKSVIEAITGNVVFSSMHLGNIGIPIAVCHAGGALGALLIYVATNSRNQNHINVAATGQPCVAA
jgi:rhomboid family GlyGly-CTERM serine protease